MKAGWEAHRQSVLLQDFSEVESSRTEDGAYLAQCLLSMPRDLGLSCSNQIWWLRPRISTIEGRDRRIPETRWPIGKV